MEPSERIWLQAGTEQWDITGDVTWCEDKVNESDTEYLLATPERETALEWIRVEDRLPDGYHDVLVSAYDEDWAEDGFIYVDRYTPDGWDEHRNITHWMPLPVPPEKK